MNTLKNVPKTFVKKAGRGTHILLGVTGGIAGGKSTVSRMLESLGAPLVDFDRLSRKVVKPGRPALKKIAAYFGRQVLHEDGALNRKSLSEIVFNDAEKRKILEGFTHPAILDEFYKAIARITTATPDAIIQASVPLLIEAGLQPLFDKLLVVYVPPDIQARRLCDRDGITASEAAAVMGSQLPIDEKVRYADFVIDNSGTLEQTRRQVEAVWTALEKMRPETAVE